jgi:hypothetical protein
VSPVTCIPVTLKLEIVAPAGTFSDDCPIRLELSLLSATVVPLDGDAALMPTWHVEPAGGVTSAGLHVMPVTRIFPKDVPLKLARSRAVSVVPSAPFGAAVALPPSVSLIAWEIAC